MYKNLTFILGAVLAGAASCPAWELIPAASYGVVFLDGAPDAYVETVPARETDELWCGRLGAVFGRYAVEASYAPRYDLYAVVGAVHDFTAVARAAPIYRDRWSVYGEAGVGVSKSAAAMAFLFEEGPEYIWSPVVGVGVDYVPLEWLELDAGVSYRVRAQILRYGTVRSRAIDLYAECLFEPFKFVALGPSFRQILYGPYDYYLWAETRRNAGWVTGKETYIVATVAFPLRF
jgi:hypothetical protein